MRIKFGNKVMEVDYVYNAGGHDRFVSVNTSNGYYMIDCEEDEYARWLINTMLTKGYFDASGVDYDNSNDSTWITYCINKTEEQKVFGKWIKQ